MTRSDAVTLRAMHDADADAVLAIYQQGIDTGHATFQDRAPDWAGWSSGHLPTGRWVAQDAHGRLLGWAALSDVSSRCVYRGVAELGVYIAATARGHGVGRRLLQALIDDAERHGIWTLQAGIFPENAASVALHKAAGFRVVGVREKLGLMTFGPLAGRWRDVLLLERRSAVVGIAAADTAAAAAQRNGWRVVRQDDNGNVFVLEDNLDEETAARLVAEYTAKGHKQTYWKEK